MNREKISLLGALREDTLDNIMCINIDGPPLDNFKMDGLY